MASGLSEIGESNYLNAVDEILAVWNTFAEAVAADKLWGDQGNDRNVIVDAEAILTFLLPEMAVNRLSFHSDDGLIVVASDMAAGVSLAKISDDKYTTDLPGESRRALLDQLLDFFDTNGGNEPVFAAGTYLDVVDGDIASVEAEAEASEAARSDGDGRKELRRDVEVVDAYTYSVTVSLSTLQLIERWFPKTQESETSYEEIDRLREMASARLTDAMEGLIDSFSVAAGQSESSWESKTKRIWPKSNADLAEVRRRLKKLKRDMPRSGAFEIGWSWGPVAKKDRIMRSDREYPYVAINAPYLYFTVGALDGIKDVFSDEVQTATILDQKQQSLAQQLRVLYDLTTTYWAALALDESGGRWAIEDVPWTTADGNASEYWTLYLLRVALSRLSGTEHDSSRLVDLAQELAQRGRITRKPVPPKSDPALKLHWPGETLVLDSATPLPDGQELRWVVYDYSPQLLKLTGQLLERISSARDRAELADLVGQIWAHLRDRRETRGLGTDAWDTFESVYTDWYDENIKESHDSRSRPESAISSWYVTERVVEALVAVASGDLARPLVPAAMREFLFELVSELDYRMAQSDSKSGADHGEIQKQRIQIHEARRSLLERDPSSCMERLVQVMNPVNPDNR